MIFFPCCVFGLVFVFVVFCAYDNMVHVKNEFVTNNDEICGEHTPLQVLLTRSQVMG
jgi:hypothetical protein